MAQQRKIKNSKKARYFEKSLMEKQLATLYKRKLFMKSLNEKSLFWPFNLYVFLEYQIYLSTTIKPPIKTMIMVYYVKVVPLKQ